MTRKICAIAVLGVLLCASAAFAHKVMVGAWLEGSTLVAEVGFGNGDLAAGAKVWLQDAASGEKLLEGEADEEGVYEVQVPAEIFARGKDLLVVADAGAGHRAEAVIKAADFPDAANAEETVSAEGAGAAEAAGQVQEETSVGQAALAALVRQAVQAEVRPLRRKLESMDKKGPGVSEILGGIGYLLGFAGLAALLKRPKRDGQG